MPSSVPTPLPLVEVSNPILGSLHTLTIFLAYARAKQAAAAATESDDLDLEALEAWNPAGEAILAKILESLQSSQKQGLKEGTTRWLNLRQSSNRIEINQTPQ
jgi:hypothetical protein